MSASGRWSAAAAGVAATLLGAGAGELIAAVVAPTSSPFAVVGGALIDAAPSWAKDTAIAWFGTSDKTALLVGIGIVLLAAAAIAGLCEARWRRSGVIALATLGVIVGILSLTRPDAGLLAWLPSLLAGAAAAIALRALSRVRMPGDSPLADAGLSRRRFLTWTIGTAAVGAAMAVAGTLARAGSTAVTAVREALRLPKPSAPAPAIPASASLDVP